MADADNYQGQRLWNATIAAFAALDEFGFRVCEPNLAAWRGADVAVASETVTITVQADWLERELAVWVHVAGLRPMPIENFVPELAGLLRLPGARRAACCNAVSNASCRHFSCEHQRSSMVAKEQLPAF